MQGICWYKFRMCSFDLAEDLLALVTTEADLGLALIRQEQREPGDTSKSWTS